MKKILLFIVLPIMLFALIACDNEETKNIQAALDGIVINNIDEITEDISLPTSGLNNVKFTWTSDLPAVISNDGVVTRPSKDQGNQEVNLTVVATLGEKSLTKVFTVTVLSLDYQQLLENAKTTLTITYSVGEDASSVKNRLTLVSTKDNINVTWSSSHPNIISNSGIVTRPDHTVGDTVVTLTATLTLGAFSETKAFPVTVIAHTSPANRDPSLDESFDYEVNTLLDNTELWSVAKGGEAATIVDSVPNNIMPTGVKALKITERGGNETHYDTPIEVLGNTVIEFLFLQEDGAASVSLEAWAGGRIFSVGLLRDGRYEYRVNSQTQSVNRSVAEITPYTWYKARVEIYPETNSYKYFVYNYQNPQNPLIELTPSGGVDFSATGTISTFRIRSVGSTVASDNPHTYLTNIVVNTIEALPVNMGVNPNMTVGIGEVTGLQSEINLTTADSFTIPQPVVKNRFNGEVLVKDTDYSLDIASDVVVGAAGNYSVTYTITNLHDSRDVKIIETVVKIALLDAPVVIDRVTATNIATTESTITVTLDKVAGNLYYVKSATTLTAEQIKAASGVVMIEVTSVNVSFTITASNFDKVYVVVENDSGFSNVMFVEIITVEEAHTIKTPEQLNNLANSGGTGAYTLGNDLDFANYTWIYDAKTFKGTLDGKGFTISNLTFTAPAGIYGGLFKELDGATIKNINFHNVQLFSTDQRAGILAGRTNGSLVTIENITISNSIVTVGNDTTVGTDMYGALLIGRATGDANISNIKVTASEVIVNGKYTGGIVGYAEKVLNMTDIEAEIKVTEISSSPQLVGGIVGRVGSSGVLTLTRVIAKVDLTAAKNVGGLLGKNDGTAHVTDALVTGTLNSGNADSGAISGNKPFNTTTNVWAVALIGEGDGANKQSAPVDNTLALLDTVSLASWWLDFMPNLANSSLWDTDGFATLIREVIVKHTITLMAEGFTVDPLTVRSGSKAILPSLEKAGFNFVGWFKDQDCTVLFNEDVELILEDLTLYAKFEEIIDPQYDVIFDSKGGSDIDPQLITENETANEPTIPTKTGYAFGGWFTDDVTFANEFNFSTPITSDLTLYALWIELFTVTFEVNGGDAVDNQIIIDGEKITEVTPVKIGYTFNGWFTDSGLDNAFDANTPITSNLTLYASWTEIAPVDIATASEFIDFLNNPGEGKYYLIADLDLTGLSFTPKTFKGVLDGNNFTISNLEITIPAGTYAGLFKELDGATVKNLNFVNILLTSTDQRAGIIAGRTTGSRSSYLENITITNSKVTVGSNDTLAIDMYGALLIGRATGNTEISNVKVVASEVLVNGKYVGGLVGYAEKVLNMTDIDAQIKVTENSSSAQLVGGIVGRVGSSGVLTLTRVIANVNLTGAKNVGGLLGKNDGTAHVTDALVTGALVCGNADSGAISGNKAFNTTTNVWAVAVTGEGTGSNKQSALVDNTLASLDLVNVASWWLDFMPNLANSSLWDTDGFATIIRGTVVKHTVTIIAQGLEVDPLTVRDGYKVVLPTLEKNGYTFIGWFTDSEMETAFDVDTLITDNLMLYAKFEENSAPQFDVIFDSKGGSDVAAQLVTENENALEPAIPTKSGFAFGGWFTDDTTFENEFNFLTPITTELTLYALWLDLYTVTFEVNGGSSVTSQEVADGATITPVVSTKDGYIFKGWFTDIDLENEFASSTPITADLTLYASWEEIPPTVINTAAEFIDFLNNPTNGIYLLGANIDLTGLTYTPKAFAGNFNGQGYTISNLTFNGTGRAGLFSQLRGEFKNVILDNISITTSDDRAGIIAGEIDENDVVIENVIITNSSVSAASENGAGGVVGLVVDGKGGVTISKVSLDTVTVTNNNLKNAGGIIGYSRGSGATVINDISLSNVTVSALEHAGGVVGYIRNPLSFTVNNAVLVNINVTANNYATGFAGRVDLASNVSNVFMKDITVTSGGSYKNIVAGRYTNLTLTNVFGGNFTIDATTQGQTVLTEITDFTALDEAWYTTNLPSLTANGWAIVDSLPKLTIFII